MLLLFFIKHFNSLIIKPLMKYKNLIIVLVLLVIIGVLWVVNISNIRKNEQLFLDGTNILIGVDECFSLKKNEQVIDLKSKDTLISDYISKNYWYLYVRETDQVLNQAVKGENDFFIWLSGNTPGDFARKQLADTSLINIADNTFKHNKRRYLVFLLNRKDIFFSRTIYVAPAGNLIIIDVPGYDSSAVAKIYQDTAFVTQRLECNTK